MRNRGFTLIELVVVMTVVAILAGIMVPFIYGVWEDNEKELTQKRMADLKKAMAGDPDLKQGGVRTDFGFVGNCGQLPGAKSHSAFPGYEALANDLITPDNLLWHTNCLNGGPYLSPGFNAGTYRHDAWGNEFVYVTGPSDSAGRHVTAEIRSAGPDRTLLNGDDIWLTIAQNEVTPAQKTNATLMLTFSSPPSANLSYSAQISVNTVGPNGSRITVLCNCAPFTVGGWPGNTQVNYTIPLPDCQFADLLAVGKITAWADVFGDATCTAIKAEGQKLASVVNDRQDTLLMNLQASPVPYP